MSQADNINNLSDNELSDEVGYLVYNETLIDHFTHPRNVGEIEDPDAMAVVGDPTCGDFIRVYIKVRDGKISDFKFLTMGCPGAISTSSIATELAIGRTLGEALQLTDNDVIKAAGGIPPRKAHCSLLAIRGLHQAILNYQSSLPPSPLEPACAKPRLPKPRAAGRRFGEGRGEGNGEGK